MQKDIFIRKRLRQELCLKRKNKSSRSPEYNKDMLTLIFFMNFPRDFPVTINCHKTSRTWNEDDLITGWTPVILIGFFDIPLGLQTFLLEMWHVKTYSGYHILAAWYYLSNSYVSSLFENKIRNYLAKDLWHWLPSPESMIVLSTEQTEQENWEICYNWIILPSLWDLQGSLTS